MKKQISKMDFIKKIVSTSYVKTSLKMINTASQVQSVEKKIDMIV